LLSDWVTAVEHISNDRGVRRYAATSPGRWNAKMMHRLAHVNPIITLTQRRLKLIKM